MKQICQYKNPSLEDDNTANYQKRNKYMSNNG